MTEELKRVQGAGEAITVERRRLGRRGGRAEQDDADWPEPDARSPGRRPALGAGPLGPPEALPTGRPRLRRRPPSGPRRAGAVGTIAVSVGGTFPGVAHFSPVAEWIDNITGASMFDPPGVSAVTNAPSGAGTTVTFQSTLSLTSGATLAKNGKY